MAKAVVDNIATEKKVYAKPKRNGEEFTCVTTTADKQLAVGRENGDIAFYSRVGQNAKNCFTGIGVGEPITSLDTTKDGKWLLATQRTCLILLPCFARSDSKLTAFNKTLKYEERLVPYRLTISPGDRRRLQISEVRFTPAKFDSSYDGREAFIVTSTGRHTILWNFKSVLRGDLFDYQISSAEDVVHAADFRYGAPHNIVTALTDDV